MHQIVKSCVSVKHEIEVFETKTCTSESEMLSREKKLDWSCLHNSIAKVKTWTKVKMSPN